MTWIKPIEASSSEIACRSLNGAGEPIIDIVTITEPVVCCCAAEWRALEKLVELARRIVQPEHSGVRQEYTRQLQNSVKEILEGRRIP